MENLFSEAKRPLAYRLIPDSLDGFIGQKHIMGKGKPLRKLIEKDAIKSCIFWGPPGTGKTTLARLISKVTKAEFIQLNAATTNLQEVKKALERGRENLKIGRKTIIFLDEIHRFNRLQQDALLPDIEEGNVILIGASTENPYFSLVPALRSRVKLYEFKPLNEDELRKLAKWAINDRKGLNGKIELSEEALDYLVKMAAGDGRKLLNYLEELATIYEGRVGISEAKEVVGISAIKYSRKGYHYDIISAFIKSVRGSDPDAAIYYLAKMLVGGEDPMFIARRLAILASEDIGNANPDAILIANAAMEITSKIGMPEAAITLAQATIYLSMSPKSNSAYKAIKKAMSDVESGVELPVPPHLRKPFKGYLYPHDFPRHWINQEYMTKRRKYYQSDGIGFEKKLEEWLKWLKGELPEVDVKEEIKPDNKPKKGN